MTRKIIKTVQGVDTQDGAGVSLSRILGQQALPRLDPFLMLDYFGSDAPSDYVAGFPSHPHRGFQTVTYMLAGRMRHRDSVGNDGVIEPGGIQWMNAGKGIIHEELPEQSEGLLKGFQLWVNLPAKDKMSEPGYQDIKPEQVPVIKQQGHTIRLLAGELFAERGPVAGIPVDPLFADLSIDGELTLPVKAGHNAFVYCFDGNVSVQGTPLAIGELGVLGEGDSVTLSGTGRLLLVAGQPIGETVVQYGPFVMNSEAEIQQAFQDYQTGKLA